MAIFHLVSCSKDGPDNEGGQHADRRGEKQGSSSKPINKRCRAASNDKVENLETSVDKVLRLSVGDTDIIKDKSKVPTDKLVTTPLDNETQRGDNDQAMTVSLCK